MRTLLAAVAFALAVAAAAQTGGFELDSAYDEMLAAHIGLKKAEAASQFGVEPEPGERLGTVGAGTRLRDEYWERQKRLEEDLVRARKRLDDAIARWNAVR